MVKGDFYVALCCWLSALLVCGLQHNREYVDARFLAEKSGGVPRVSCPAQLVPCPTGCRPSARPQVDCLALPRPQYAQHGRPDSRMHSHGYKLERLRADSPKIRFRVDSIAESNRRFDSESIHSPLF